MNRPHRIAMYRRSLRTLCVAALAAALFSIDAAAAFAQSLASPLNAGQKYFLAAHDFNAFIGPNPRTGEPGPLHALAVEAGLAGHESLGVQVVSGSAPMRHWSQGGSNESQNLAKAALRTGGVGVFAMSPGARMPEEEIDLFGNLMIETNHMGRILVESSWSLWDDSAAGTPGFTNADRGKADVATIQGWIDRLHSAGGYLERLHTQLMGIDAKVGHRMTYIVPVADAVYRLRQEVVRGNVPGIERQSQLFVDAVGHPATPIVNLVTYVWFSTMYIQPSGGLTALVDPSDPTSEARERFLQRLAWEVVVAEPMSGLTDKSTAPMRHH